MNSNWNGEQFFASVRERITRNVGKAATELREDYRTLIGIQGPPRSKPGEPPHRDTGDLQASLEVNGPAEQGDMIVASIGTRLAYGAYLEFGTSKMAARPWLVPGLRNNREKIAKTIIGTNQMTIGEFARSGASGANVEISKA